MNRKNILGVALAGALAMSATVMASVTFDAATGTGFVGKGDVQTAFGWNNAQAQAKIPYISFAADESQTRQQECLTEGQPPQIFTGYRHGLRTLNKNLSYDARMHQQIDGIFLTGYAGGESEWSDWSEWVGPNGETFGNACPDGSHPAHEPILGPIVAEGLFVIYNGVSVKIWP
jgi:hypothetical protein